MKKPLLERFQQLAGIKPLYSINKREEGTNEEGINEQVVAAAAGFVAMVSAAGGMAALQMKMEDPETRTKHPKLAAFLDILGELGSAASSARIGEAEDDMEGGMEDGMEGEEASEEDIENIESELESMFDIKDSCPSEE